MSTPFDPNAYLNVEISEPTVRRPPLTPGDYIAVIGEVKADTWAGKPGGKAEGRSGVMWIVPLLLQVPPNEAGRLGLKEPTLNMTDRIMLDLNEQGGIDNGLGKNGKMRQYREALDMNKPGDKFGPRLMQGRPIRVKVKNDTYQGELIDQVDGVARV